MENTAPTLVVTEIDGTEHHVEADEGTLRYRLPKGIFRMPLRWIPAPPDKNPTLVGA